VYPGGVIMTVLDHGRNGIMFTGTEGRIFVNRGTLSGKPVEDLADAPLERDDFRLYPHDNLDRPPRMGKHDSILNHMGNFFDCVKTRNTPISDVVSQHQIVSPATWATSPCARPPAEMGPQAEHSSATTKPGGLLATPEISSFSVNVPAGRSESKQIHADAGNSELSFCVTRMGCNRACQAPASSALGRNLAGSPPFKVVSLTHLLNSKWGFGVGVLALALTIGEAEQVRRNASEPGRVCSHGAPLVSSSPRLTLFGSKNQSK
jgi:hypothetical protein